MGSDQDVADGGQVPLFTDEQLLFTAEQAAQRLQIGRTTLYALLKDGQLRAVHIGRSCRLTRAELLRYVARLDVAGEHGDPGADNDGDGDGAQVVDLAAARRPDPPDAA